MHISQERQRARRLQNLSEDDEPVEPVESMNFYTLGMHDGVSSQVVGGELLGHHGQLNPHMAVRGAL